MEERGCLNAYQASVRTALQHARRRAITACMAATRRATHKAPALLLLDDINLLFDDLVADVERRTAAVRAGFRT